MAFPEGLAGLYKKHVEPWLNRALRWLWAERRLVNIKARVKRAD